MSIQASWRGVHTTANEEKVAFQPDNAFFHTSELKTGPYNLGSRHADAFAFVCKDYSSSVTADGHLEKRKPVG